MLHTSLLRVLTPLALLAAVVALPGAAFAQEPLGEMKKILLSRPFIDPLAHDLLFGASSRTSAPRPLTSPPQRASRTIAPE